jgi:hypothetical protein
VAGPGRDDLVVSREAAARILAANRRGRFLERWAVSILIWPLSALRQAPARGQATTGAEPRISLILHDTPLRTALERLFQPVGWQHAVAEAVPNVPVRLDLRDVTFTTALRVITRLAGAIYQKVEDVYVIDQHQPLPVGPTTEAAPSD